MTWKKLVFKKFKLYAITDIRNFDGTLLDKINDAYRGGADIIQLRSKTLSDAELFKWGLRIRKLAAKWRRLFFVNDRLDLALALQADGLHLGQDDMPIAAVRQICKKNRTKLWVGKSTHSLKQALSAQKEGADYIGVGPIFDTPTKPDYQAVGLDLITQVQSKIKIPFVVIGGIDRQNLHQVLGAGASRIAVVRAVFSGKDVYGNAKKLRDQIEKQN